uniref:Reverse transcriptase domain-containing protein n=1 Tax=Strongyloides papillosus TaxID=174720 RepID=A0A0N5CDY8_STREA
MGAKNLPMIFQRQMEKIFENVVKYEPKSRFLICQDDLLFITQRREKHLQMLERILDTLGQKNCKLISEDVNYLERGIHFSHENLMEYQLTKTKGFLYTTFQAYNYFRIAISDYTNRTYDFYKLSRRNYYMES